MWPDAGGHLLDTAKAFATSISMPSSHRLHFKSCCAMLRILVEIGKMSVHFPMNPEIIAICMAYNGRSMPVG